MRYTLFTFVLFTFTVLAIPTSNSCNWVGHCLGATCNNEDDCSDALVCNTGVCGVDTN